MIANKIKCECGHNLATHPPDPARPFSWPCAACQCPAYRETEEITEPESGEAA